VSDKESALKKVDEEAANLQKALEGLSNEQMEQPFLDGWSVRDLMGHILGWQRESTMMLERMARGERPAPEGTDYSKPDEWNAKFALAVAGVNPNTVIASWRQANGNFVRAAQAMPEDRFKAKDDGTPSTASRILEGNGYGHFREHIEHIQTWRKSAGI
jgi:uncharacterized protein (TIGR03083 family)